MRTLVADIDNIANYGIKSKRIQDIFALPKHTLIPSILTGPVCLANIALVQEKETSVNIPGIETSCDETAAAAVADGRIVKSSVAASQSKLHEKYGGVPSSKRAILEAGSGRQQGNIEL